MKELTEKFEKSNKDLNDKLGDLITLLKSEYTTRSKHDNDIDELESRITIVEVDIRKDFDKKLDDIKLMVKSGFAIAFGIISFIATKLAGLF
jgi:hypothetical protein